MGRILLAIFLSFALVVCAYADDTERKWTKTDTAFQLAYYTLHTVDWLQTRYIAKRPEKYYESNPLIGTHPSIGRVNTYFAVTAVINTLVPYALPKPYRTYWQGGMIGIEAVCIGSNARLGVKLQF